MMSETPGWEPDIAEELTEGPEAPERPRMGALARIVQVFVSPVEVFRDIARKPTWVAILLLTMVVSAGTQFVVMPHLDMETTIRQSLEKRGSEVTEEQLDTMLANADRMAWLGPVSSLVIVPVAMVVLAAIYLLGLKLAGSDIDFLHSFSATLHAYWPASVAKAAILVALVSRVGKVPAQEMERLIRSNLAAFLGPDSPAWQVKLATSFDVFNLWTFALLVVGLAIVGRIPRARAAVVTGLLWGTWIAGKVAFAALLG